MDEEAKKHLEEANKRRAEARKRLEEVLQRKLKGPQAESQHLGKADKSSYRPHLPKSTTGRQKGRGR